jgi:hypothetical protein
MIGDATCAPVFKWCRDPRVHVCGGFIFGNLAEFAIFQVALKAKNLFFRGQPAAFSAGASSWRLLR